MTALVDRVGGTGALGREVAVRLDIARAAGLRYAWRRFADEAKERRKARVPGRAHPVHRGIWVDAARLLGADVVALPAGFLELRKDGAWTRVWRQWVMLDDAVTLRFALQKTIIQERVRGAGPPTPENLEFDASDPAPAVDFLARGP